MRLILFVLFCCSCIRQQGAALPKPVGNPDYQPYCPPLFIPPAPTVSEWVKKYQSNFTIDPEGEDGNTCTIEEEETE